MFVAIVTVALAWLFDLHDAAGLATVGEISSGLPTLTIPPFRVYSVISPFIGPMTTSKNCSPG